jgi:hypothetical protein
MLDAAKKDAFDEGRAPTTLQCLRSQRRGHRTEIANNRRSF